MFFSLLLASRRLHIRLMLSERLALLSAPWYQAACNTNKHSKPSWIFYLHFISSYFSSSQRKLFPTVLYFFYQRSALASLLFVARMHVFTLTNTLHKEPPSCSTAAVWCRGISCGVRLPAVPEVIFCSCAQGVFLRRADKAKKRKRKKSLHLPGDPITPSELFLSFRLWPAVNRRTPALSRPCREDMNGLPVVHWQIRVPWKIHFPPTPPPNPPQGVRCHRWGTSCCSDLSPLPPSPFTSSVAFTRRVVCRRL